MSHAPGLRPSVLAARKRLADGRQRIKARHDRGTPGVQVCGALADLLDAVVLDLFHAALTDLDEDGRERLADQVALVAHGGYGRRDVAPYSDVDLMVLHARGAGRVGRLAERLMRDVFDSGLILGHSVRTAEQACNLALRDATICTSLIESRFLAGSEALFGKFAQQFGHQVNRRAGSLIASMDAARGEERSQFGETVYLLEPNIKRSRGGLRDLQLLRWVGFARYATADPDGLQLCGALSKKDQQAVRQAWEFLLRLRNEMHFFAGKSSDVLDRAEQVRLADLFGFPGGDALLPVEDFMREYFRHTEAVSNIVTRFVANARPGSRWVELLGRLFGQQAEGGDFRIGPARIAATKQGLAKLRGNLREVLRLADVANRRNKRIAHATCEAVRESAPDISGEIDPEAAAGFLSLVSQPARLGSLLRFLHEMGVLERIIPAFVHARCLLQFNEYHKYTVDEHCLRSVERVTEFLHDGGPVGRVYRQIKHKGLLHLALLIHDLGKGHVEDHSEVGLRIAIDTAGRLGLSEREAETLQFLVHKHLLMSHLAFRRDTSDEDLVLRFAVDVGSPEVLRMLFVLTCADLAAVGPGVLNDWKVRVLTDLHDRAMRHLAGDSPALTSHERQQQARDAVLGCLGPLDPAGWHARQVSALPPAYLEGKRAAEIATEIKELATLRPDQAAAHGRYLPERRTVEYTIGTYEAIAPGVFHRLCGALSGKGLEILSAEIHTLADGLVLDRFVVRDPDHPGEPPRGRVETIERALEQSLLCPTSAAAFRKVWRSGQHRDRAALPSPPTQIKADNSTSDRFTILDVFAADRSGLLYTIARTLFDLGLSVSVAKIGTYLDQVVDVFYVTDQQGRKIQSDEWLAHIRARLLEEIHALEREEAEQVGTR